MKAKAYFSFVHEKTYEILMIGTRHIEKNAAAWQGSLELQGKCAVIYDATHEGTWFGEFLSAVWNVAEAYSITRSYTVVSSWWYWEHALAIRCRFWTCGNLWCEFFVFLCRCCRCGTYKSIVRF